MAVCGREVWQSGEGKYGSLSLTLGATSRKPRVCRKPQSALPHIITPWISPVHMYLGESVDLWTRHGRRLAMRNTKDHFNKIHNKMFVRVSPCLLVMCCTFHLFIGTKHFTAALWCFSIASISCTMVSWKLEIRAAWTQALPLGELNSFGSMPGAVICHSIHESTEFLVFFFFSVLFTKFHQMRGYSTYTEIS